VRQLVIKVLDVAAVVFVYNETEYIRWFKL